MGQYKICGAKISGITCCVGPEVQTLEQVAHLYGNDPQQIERLRKMTGVETRAVAPAGITTLDLGEQAARRLLEALRVNVNDLDAIVFVTQTPDYEQPSNANLLHGRLKCAKPVAAWDINQGCSGWVYGLYQAYALVIGGGMQRVLLLAGDTVTQAIHPGDRAVVPLFGDACSATLVEKDADNEPSWFALHSDGSGSEAIWIPAGGYRKPLRGEKGDGVTLGTGKMSDGAEDGDRQSIGSLGKAEGELGTGQLLEEETDADGNVRTAAHLHMNGLEVFNFTLREEPKAIRELLEFSGHAIEEVDGFALHQANRFILSNLATRLKITQNKAPFEAGARYGNQSSASVPGALCTSFGEQLCRDQMTILCSGFGVGLSWASCLFRWKKLGCAEVFVFRGLT